jgi:AraC-like DNA-binding protein
LAGLASLHEPTVREALLTIAEGQKTSDTGGVVTFDVHDGTASVGYVVTAPGIENVHHVQDQALAVLLNSMRQFCGAAWRPDHAYLTRNPPRDPGRYARLFKAPIDFGAPAAKLEFGAGVLDRTVRNHDPRSLEIIRSALDPMLGEADDNFEFAVKAMLRNQIVAGRVTRKSVAHALRLSEDTLIRNLRAYNLRFADLADQTKFEQGRRLLLDNRTVEQVATALGYADASAFVKAFKKWAGQTPGRWREEHAAARKLAGA